MNPFYALLAAVYTAGVIAAVLVVRGNLSVILRRRPQPRKPTAPGES